jgi:predicted RNase H-like nuclease (RuvC/YqgF family)
MTLDFLFANSITFIVGIIIGVSLYRTIWWMDTRELQKEIRNLRVYNSNLQNEIVTLQNALSDMRTRLDLIEDANRDMSREMRSMGSREASAQALAKSMASNMNDMAEKQRQDMSDMAQGRRRESR